MLGHAWQPYATGEEVQKELVRSKQLLS